MNFNYLILLSLFGCWCSCFVVVVIVMYTIVVLCDGLVWFSPVFCVAATATCALLLPLFRCCITYNYWHRVSTASFQQSNTQTLVLLFYASHAFIFFAIGIYDNCVVSNIDMPPPNGKPYSTVYTMYSDEFWCYEWNKHFFFFFILLFQMKKVNEELNNARHTMTYMFDVCLHTNHIIHLEFSTIAGVWVRIFFLYFFFVSILIWIRFYLRMSSLFFFFFFFYSFSSLHASSCIRDWRHSDTKYHHKHMHAIA